ncbi:glucose 1-dehydrogenase [Rhodococcus sp. NPDC057014]|uniref:glucose 1-dehydrogenase n=1 Tax=Rhodococcus sp. NPDC057014 TaxID=3346000 RepID=UPI003631862B
MTGRVAGKVAIVTGGGGGLGRAISETLIAEGAIVYLTDINTDTGNSAATSLGDNARFVPHDVTEYTQWQTVVAAAETAGPVSILVNCAGVGPVAMIADTSPEDYRRVIEINQVSVFLGTKAVLDSMRKAGGGSIVNISSAGGLVGFPGLAGYVSSKFAMRGFTKTAAIELGPEGIRVNSVHPGIVNTDMLRTNPMQEEVKAAAKQLALGRVGEPPEIAALVLYLASDESSYSTGSEFVADGGWSCQ